MPSVKEKTGIKMKRGKSYDGKRIKSNHLYLLWFWQGLECGKQSRPHVGVRRSLLRVETSKLRPEGIKKRGGES